MSYEEFLLALVIWREARGEGHDGMVAVGCVIRNRAHDWGQTFYKAIVGQNQFSSMTIKGDSQTVLWPAPDDGVIQIARDVYSGATGDTTGGAHYYANEAAMNSVWYQKNIIESPEHPVTLALGKHTFRR